MKIIIDDFRLNGDPKSTLKADADITLYYSRGSVLRIYGVRLIYGRSGYFVSMPSLRRGNKFRQTCEILDLNLNGALLTEMRKLYEMCRKGDTHE